MKYTKPRPTYEEQLDLMESRELHCRDRAEALQRLSTIGYYRLSGYVYPFKELLSQDQQQYRLGTEAVQLPQSRQESQHSAWRQADQVCEATSRTL